MRSKSPMWAALFGLSSLLVAIGIVIAVPPAQQYEISLYGAYPGYFWALVVASFFGGSLAIVASARTGGRSWMFGLPVVLLTNALLVLMPFARGYRMFGRADPMTHLGFVLDLVNSGSTGGNIYPPMHLLVMALTGATRTDLMTLAPLLPALFSLLYFGSMFYLLRVLYDSREKILFGLPFAVLPVLRFAHLSLRPFDLAVMLIPLSLYLFFKGQRNPTPAIRAAFVVVIFAQLLYHPLTALFVIGVFSLYLGGKYAPRVRKQYATPTNLFSLLLAVFLIWYSKFAGIIIRFEKIYFTLFGSSQGQPPMAAYTGTVEESSPALADIVRIALIKYGVEFVLFGLGFAFIAVALVLVLRSEYVPEISTVMLAGTLVTFSVGGLVFLSTDLIVPPNRPFQIAKIGAVVLVGQFFYRLWDYVDWSGHRPIARTGLRVTLTLSLLILISLSTLSVYKSPLGSEKNEQVTEMELEGTEWLATHGQAADELDRFGLTYARFYHAQYGTNGGVPYTERPPPAHFNYMTNSQLGQSYETDHYLTITRKGRIVYPEVFPNYRDRWRFTPADFDRLERDRTTVRIYDSGDYTQYLVTGTADRQRDDAAE